MSQYKDISGALNIALNNVHAGTQVKEDLSDIADVGSATFAANQGKNLFTNLVDVITDQYMVVDAYKGKLTSLYRTDNPGISQRIYFENLPFVSDDSYNLQDGASYDQYQVRLPQTNAKYWSKKDNWSQYFTLSKTAWEDSFISPQAFADFFAGIQLAIRNGVEEGKERIAMDTLNSFIGTIIDETKSTGTNPKPQMQRHLITEYNTAFGLTGSSAITLETCQYSKEFWRWVAYQVDMIKGRMAQTTKQFNAANRDTFSPPNRVKTYILDQARAAMQTYLYSNNEYNSEIIPRLDITETLSYIQFEGDYSFSDITNLCVKLPNGNSVGTVDGTGSGNIHVLGAIFDERACWINMTRENAASCENVRARYQNVFQFFSTSLYNDLALPACVLLLD